ncbi:MAG: hypothetical protein N2Z81_06855 [Hydrogenothermaceae bacterium]|nr:hypothetical protein [Hydrogenothermaceae bacterium]
MKSKGVIWGLFGILVGLVAGFIIYKKRKEILRKLEEISDRIEDSNIYDRVKDYLGDIKQSISKLLDRSKDLPREKEEEILSLVEEKIKKLEEIIKS